MGVSCSNCSRLKIRWADANKARSRPNSPREISTRLVAHRTDYVDLTSAQNCPNARKKFAQREGLCDVVVGAELESHHAFRYFVTPGDHDDRHARCFAHGSGQP